MEGSDSDEGSQMVDDPLGKEPEQVVGESRRRAHRCGRFAEGHASVSVKCPMTEKVTG